MLSHNLHLFQSKNCFLISFVGPPSPRGLHTRNTFEAELVVLVKKSQKVVDLSPSQYGVLTEPSVQSELWSNSAQTHADVVIKQGRADLQAASTTPRGFLRRATCCFPPGPTESVCVELRYGDILLDQDVEAVTNAANNNLKPGGGTANAILNEAGDEVVKECAAYITKHGVLPSGQAVATTAGSLRGKRRTIIHTVAPIYGKTCASDEATRKVLQSCITSALECAENAGCESVVMPMVGTGTYMCPPLMFMEAFTAALRAFSFDSVTKIRLTDMNHEHVELAADFIDRHFPHDLMPGTKLQKWKRTPQLGQRIMAAPTLKFFWRNDSPGKAFKRFACHYVLCLVM